MSAFAEHREVRVTRRKSITMPFVAAELSPVRTVDQELDKGLKGWTDFDKKIEVEGNARPKGLAERELEAMNVGTRIRRSPAPRQGRVVSPTGPSAHYQAMKARAAALSAR
ncbi:hypothetical protein PBI_IRONMAN_92 [Mycobacterium phage IronMan]|uniref:Uncharacterized protein n=1 Tax=Mycobacterium phage IronMan TaxID=2499042 RepID=A0A3S9UDD8_9CAUD|nr:hypothetical protein KI247_gp09 [Mycobacterium phage IronMan]AZS08292.1 hypothetical protein PBI_IRONMAN_92 [Mycobacterium phage IronMan]